MENKKSIKSDLGAIRGKTPEELRQAAKNDPDAQPLTREMFAKAAPWGSFKPKITRKKNIHILIDEDIIEYFKNETGGKRGYQTLINSVLRQFVEHHKHA